MGMGTLIESDNYDNMMEEAGHHFKWLFTEEQLNKTPSTKEGISHAQELVFRQKQAMLMQSIGQKSGLTQLAINTSVIFMHRFYMFRKVKFFPRIHLAIGFVFAAGKVEESARKLEHLIRFTVDILRNNKNGEFLDKRDKLTYEMDCEWREKIETLIQNNCDTTSSAYEEMRKSVLECEAEIYAVIGFQLQITHPHKFVIRMSGLLGAENIKDISQYAYNLATVTSQLTMLNLKYKPELIATVCLNIASKAHSVKFMCMKDSSVNWYQVHDSSTDMKEIETVTEEFLNLIKACSLLPSWMTNLARAPPRSNNRSQPGASKSISTAAHAVGHSHKPVPPTSSGSHHPHHPPTSSSQVRDPSKQPSSLPASISNTTETFGSQSGTGSLVSSAPSIPQSDGGLSTNTNTATSSSSHLAGQSQRSSSSSNPDPHSLHHHREGRPPHPSASASGMAHQRPVAGNRHHQVPHPQHQRSHPTAPRGNSHHKSVPVSSTGNNRPPPPVSQSTTSSSRPSGSRAAPHPSLTSSSTSSHLHLPKTEYPRRPDATDARRSQSQTPLEESYHNRQAPLEHQSSSLSSHVTEVSQDTPPPKPITPPEPLMQQSQASDTLSQGVTDFLASPESNNSTLSSDLNKQRLVSQGPKLTLSSYRERFGGKIRPGPNSSQSDSITDDSGIQTGASEENVSMETNTLSTVDSPANSSVRSTVSTPDLSSSAFSVPQDSPTNPRIKLKVKRDQSLGEKHSIKFADSGLKIKIKPLKMESKEEEVAGPSGIRSTTPIEEGEVVDSPGSTGSSDRRSEGSLKIRLNIPKTGNAYKREGSSGDMGTNGLRGDGDQAGGHRSHHHRSHHRHGHHHSHKSKKHSKHSDPSRHEGKSSKRSAGDHLEERPSKSSRLDYLSTDNQSFRGSVQHQNSGFSINDAFSSTMPSNIFDDEEESSQSVPPPITPTPDMLAAPSGHQLFRSSSQKGSSLPSMNSLLDDNSVPAHHQRFHQLMAQHRADQAKKPPLPPLPASNQPPPPPPPPPPHSPPPPPAY